MITVITEKPSVAKSIAKVIGAGRWNDTDGWWEGDGYIVTNALGHLVDLDGTPYDGCWTEETLPVLPDTFGLLPRMIEDQKGKRSDKSSRQQLETIHKAASLSTSLICATDAGREGELVFRYIYTYLGLTLPWQRLWISSLTDEAIRTGFRSLEPSRNFDSLYLSAKARNEADWVVGINATRALTIAVGGKPILRQGRVMSPTLGLICRRQRENLDFVPTPYWILKIKLIKDGVSFTAFSKEKYDQEGLAGEALKKAREGTVTVTVYDQRDKRITPPLPHDLNTLQREGVNRFKMTAQEVLNTAQSLYEKKLITYPRTDCRYIPEDVFATIPALLSSHAATPVWGDYCAWLAEQRLCRKCVNDTKLKDHHALLVTDQAVPSGLSVKERMIWDLIMERTLETFSPPAVVNVREALLDTGGVKFYARSRETVYNGWRYVRNTSPKEEEDDDTTSATIPAMTTGDTPVQESADLRRKMTTPKPLYTEATLLTAMETAGKDSDDAAIKEAMKGKGIGTAATRAGIIEKLKIHKYIVSNGGTLVPTDLGKMVWETTRGMRLMDVEMTGEWETQLADIENGMADEASFKGRIRSFTANLTKEILEMDLEDDMMEVIEKDKARCWKCGKDMTETKGSFRCDCGCYIPKQLGGKALSEKTIKTLISTGHTRVLKGFKKKDGSGTFDAALMINEEDRVAYDFSPLNEPKRKRTYKKRSGRVTTRRDNDE